MKGTTTWITQSLTFISPPGQPSKASDYPVGTCWFDSSSNSAYIANGADTWTLLSKGQPNIFDPYKQSRVTAHYSEALTEFLANCGSKTPAEIREWSRLTKLTWEHVYKLAKDLGFIKDGVYCLPPDHPMAVSTLKQRSKNV